jgi:chromosome segregation ATPase
MEDKLAVDVTLARGHLDRISQAATGMEARHKDLSELLPEARHGLDSAETHRQESAARRGAAEAERSDVVRRLSAVTVDVGKLDGDLALAAERLTNAAVRRERLLQERGELETRAQQAEREQETADQRHQEATLEHDRIQQELDRRSQAEESVRQRPTLREQVSQAAAHHSTIQTELAEVEERREAATAEASQLVDRAREARSEAERGRHLVAEAREREALVRADQRRAEETVAQLTARRQALEELERDRVGLAPGAAALLKVRSKFGGAVLGPLSDFIQTSQRDARLAERLLGEWMHAVLVRDSASLTAIQEWHASTKGSTLVLLPADRTPPASSTSQPLDDRLRIDHEAAAQWVEALLGGAEVLDDTGQVTRHPTGAIVLAAPAGPSGPLQRRAELEGLVQVAADAERTLETAALAVAGAVTQIGSREAALLAATQALEETREAERHGIAARDDMIRLATGLEGRT